MVLKQENKKKTDAERQPSSYCLKHKTLRLYAVPGATAANGTTFTTSGLRLFACPLVRGSHGMSGFPAFAGNFTLFLRTH